MIQWPVALAVSHTAGLRLSDLGVGNPIRTLTGTSATKVLGGLTADTLVYSFITTLPTAAACSAHFW